MIVNLHGNRISGRYVLIQTDGKNWLVRRMKEQRLQPMLATHGSVRRLSSEQWAFEGKWDGYRLLVEADHGRNPAHLAQWPRYHGGVPAIAVVGS
ncbi:hypothetical protein MAUB1S_02614 [Mycolicibacterium aubagnense]